MMKIHKLILTKNNCYKTGKKHAVKGIMWHSTGANNPYLSRYVGPDDGNLGKNKYNNHWNQPKPGGRNVCVHAFIGYLKDGKNVAVYQTLPWDRVGWHSGYGSKGSANTQGYIGFEICEDNLKNKKYFDEVYKKGVELTAYLCKLYNIPVNSRTVIDHAEGYKLGIASNHGDITHWLKRYGKTMNDVRNDVKKLLGGNSVSSVTFYRRGHTGEGVKKLQQDLSKLGYKVAIDSSFGPDMDKKVRQFQKDNKLAVDGSAGPATLKKIDELLKKQSQVSSKNIHRVIVDGKQVGSYTELKNVINQIESNIGKSKEILIQKV